MIVVGYLKVSLVGLQMSSRNRLEPVHNFLYILYWINWSFRILIFTLFYLQI